MLSVLTVKYWLMSVYNVENLENLYFKSYMKYINNFSQKKR